MNIIAANATPNITVAIGTPATNEDIFCYEPEK